MQASENAKEMNMYEFARFLLERFGPQVFWVGVETSAMQSATEKALYFLAYTTLKTLYCTANQTTSIRTLPNLVLGCMAEWAHLPITLPIDCWTTRIQTNTTNESAMSLLCNMLSEKVKEGHCVVGVNTHEFVKCCCDWLLVFAFTHYSTLSPQSIHYSLSLFHRRKGMYGMYKGIQAYVVLCFKPAIQYTIFEQVKRLLLKGKKRTTLTALESFLLGMLARTVATVLVFPYLRAKVVLQSTQEEEEKEATMSILSLLTKLYKEQGIGACFQGLGPELTRGIFSAALMLMIKEQLASLVHKALYGTVEPQQTQVVLKR